MDRLQSFRAQGIIFDKDGTLIDFDFMWGGWVLYLAEQLQSISGLPVREPLCLAMGYDDSNRKVLAHGKLAYAPMAELYQLTVDVVQSLGLNKTRAEQTVQDGWCIPDPVLLAKPFTDTRDLFSKLHQAGVKLGIATTDDRAPTQAMIEAFDLEEYLTAMVCADDGIPAKPAPDMALTICQRMNIHPSKAIVIGDTTADLKMARAAGAGLVVGVLSGASASSDLIAYADVLIDSVDELHAYAEALSEHENARQQNGLNPDFAF